MSKSTDLLDELADALDDLTTIVDELTAEPPPRVKIEALDAVKATLERARIAVDELENQQE